jgi:sialidase-1
MDLKSWPLAAKAEQQIRDAMKFYGFTSEDSLRQFRGNPLDLLEPIAAARIPLRHVISLTDRIVPPEDNTLEAQRRLRRLGWDIDVVVVADPEERLQGHHFTVPAADIERSVAFIEKHAAADRQDRRP